MSAAGWYPDPGGAPGMFRYWDGSRWSEGLSPAPGPSRRGRLGMVLVVVLIGLVLAGLIFGGSVLLRQLGGATAQGDTPTGQTQQKLCPPRDVTNETPPEIVGGRVRGGHLSYPLLGSPWTAPQIEARFPFGRGVATQIVPVEPNYDGDATWVASVLVGEVIAGDGFFDPKSGTELLVTCSLGLFYSDAVLRREDRVSKAITVDGRAGWLLESHLSFDIPHLKEKGETAIFVLVQTSNESASIYYASIPDSRPDLLQQARRAQAGLRYES